MHHQENDKQIFNTLYDQYKHLGLPLEQIKHTDFTVFNLKEINQPTPFKSPLSRLNFFVFAFIKSGDGDYTIDEQNYKLQPRAVYFTNPGHVRSFNWERIGDVYLFTLSESFLKENVHANIFDEFPFLLAETFPAKILAPEIFEEFDILYHQIRKEYNSESPYRYRIIGNLFVVILLKFKEHIWKDYNPIYEGNRSSEIVKNFKRLLEKHYRDLNSSAAERVFRVQDYADAQSLHPNYLSNVIKIKTGKTISTWIAEKTISEAKALLQNSQASIKEIAYRLGFTEATHFSNYFKKHTDTSPALFRKEHSTMTS
jgi:AraC family transcriptional activator of pobA